MIIAKRLDDRCGQAVRGRATELGDDRLYHALFVRKKAGVRGE